MKKAVFLFGGPGSGKDYVLTHICPRFGLTEVQADQVLKGSVSLVEAGDVVVNGISPDKSEAVAAKMKGYNILPLLVSVTNQVSRQRNEQRTRPLPESKRVEKWFKLEKLSNEDGVLVFDNSLNLSTATESQQKVFVGRIEKLLEGFIKFGLVMEEKPAPKSLSTIKAQNSTNTFVCPYCSKEHSPKNDTKNGSDISCCGEVGHVMDKQSYEKNFHEHVNEAFAAEVFEVGTNAARENALSMTPGQEEIQDVTPPKTIVGSRDSTETRTITDTCASCGCSDGSCGCPATSEDTGRGSTLPVGKSFRAIRNETTKAIQTEEKVPSNIDTKPTVEKQGKKIKNQVVPPNLTTSMGVGLSI